MSFESRSRPERSWMERSTPEASRMSTPSISSDSDNAISSLAEASGALARGSLDGRTSENSGRDPAPARAKASRAKSSAPMIQGICGPTFFVSSVPDGPLKLWESKLRERLARIGSTEFGLTWKRRATPSGRSISRLVPSTRRISVTGSIGQEPLKGWPSPTVAWADGGQTSRSGDRRGEMLIGGLVREGSTRSTPTVQDAENCAGPSQFNRNSAALNVQAAMHEMEASTWSTPRASDGEKGGPNQSFGAGGMPLAAQAAMTKEASSRTTPCADDTGLRTKPYAQGGSALSLQAGGTKEWARPTPTSSDALGSRRHGYMNDGMERAASAQRVESPTGHPGTTLLDAALLVETEAIGPVTNGGSAPTGKRGALNPDFAFWLMGFPAEYRSCALLAMQSLPKPARKSSRR